MHLYFLKLIINRNHLVTIRGNIYCVLTIWQILYYVSIYLSHITALWDSVLVSVLLENGTDKMCIYWREIYFKELAPMTVGVGKFNIYRTKLQTGNSSRNWCCGFKSESSLKTEFFPLQEFSLGFQVVVWDPSPYRG